MLKKTFALTSLATVALLAGCASSPKIAMPDESTRRPANNETEIERIREKARADRLEVELRLARRMAQARLMAEEVASMPVVLRSSLQPRVSGANIIYTASFGVGSSRLVLPPRAAAALVAEARKAPLVMLRGRTDARVSNPVDERIARARAQAAFDLLAASGVPKDRIRMTWQASGDLPGDAKDGKPLNPRRVEIEVYREAPEAMPDDGPAPAAESGAVASR